MSAVSTLTIRNVDPALKQRLTAGFLFGIAPLDPGRDGVGFEGLGLAVINPWNLA
jgi:hypothetical protein